MNWENFGKIIRTTYFMIIFSCYKIEKFGKYNAKISIMYLENIKNKDVKRKIILKISRFKIFG